jgi:hypothetical protein
MKHYYLIALLGTVGFAFAHEEGERAGGQRSPGGMMARLPITKALDKDADGELSAEEIAGATAALLTLDKNGDGKLSGEEIRPVMQPRGETAHQTAHRTLEEFDKNKDGKLVADELPARMKTIIERADEDKDGAVTEEELIKRIEKDAPPAEPRPEGKAPEKTDA